MLYGGCKKIIKYFMVKYIVWYVEGGGGRSRKCVINYSDVWLVDCPVSQFYHLRVCLKGEMNEFKSELTKTVKDKLSY